MWRRRITVPEHVLAFNPFLPEDGGQNNGGGGQQSGGTGQGGDGGQQNQGQQSGGTGQGQQQNQGQQGGQSGGTGQGQQGGQQQNLDSLPDWAQKLIRDTRAEAASARTSAKTTAAQEAREGILQELGRALGFVKDQPLDPTKLAEDLKAKDGEHRETTVQLAVLRAAPKAGADAEALLDSRSFLNSLAELDPSTDGFAGQVQAAIEKAVRDNPKLGAGTPITSGGGEIKGGTKDNTPDDMSWDNLDKLAKGSRKPGGWH